MPAHPALALIERRSATNLFDPAFTLSDEAIADLVRLATRAPTAYHLQNWRFHGVRSPEAKARLRRAAYGQAKVADAAVTFIVSGLLPDADLVPARLQPSVDAGLLPAALVADWQAGVRKAYEDPRTARDEAIRSATLGATTLIHAASALDLATGPMVGFDPKAVAREFDLAEDEVPVMLVAVGRAAPGNWPQKPRRAVAELLALH